MDSKQFKEEYIMVTTSLNAHYVKVHWQDQHLQLCYRQQSKSLLPTSLGDAEMLVLVC